MEYTAHRDGSRSIRLSREEAEELFELVKLGRRHLADRHGGCAHPLAMALLRELPSSAAAIKRLTRMEG